MMVEFSENRKLTVEEKLEETLYELNATKNKLLAADKYLKVTEEEMEKYRQEVEEMQEELQEFNLTFNHKIAVQERNALANWVRRGVREFPHCPGLLRMPYHMGWNVPDFPHPHPPPQWWTCGPQPHLVPPPHGLQSQSEACGAQGDNSSTVPEKVPEKNQGNHFVI
ncbi:transport and Golgi organization protein 1 homolog isoform X5 [Neovison vison]|uniref:transport and Golgi organization protein 1 homolog isoform X5 n=1 Tax=Neovison vison TaxID=452646 RepID=UPI001CF0B665|nr:transport and Golgi organization protein 1 homolog isoform X5 [Neogale vison]